MSRLAQLAGRVLPVGGAGRLAQLAGRGAPEGATPQDEIEEPNNLERFLAETIGKVPVLQELFTSLGRPLFAVANAFTGDFGGAARNIGQFLTDIPDALLPGNVIPDIAKPEDVKTFRDVLTHYGVGDLGRVDLPLIGEVTGKGALGFGLDVLADPLRVSRVGALTKTGRAAAKAGELAKPAMVGGKVGSRLAAQAAAGQRALLQFMGKTVLRDIPLFGGSSFLSAIDTALRGSRRLTPWFNIAANPEVTAALGKEAGRAIMEAGDVRGIAAFDVISDYVRLAREAGIDENVALEWFRTGAERKVRVKGGVKERGKAGRLAEEATRKAEAAAGKAEALEQLGQLDPSLAEGASTFRGLETKARNQAVKQGRAAEFAKERAAFKAEYNRLAQKFGRQTSMSDLHQMAVVKRAFPDITDDMLPFVVGYTRHFRDVFRAEDLAGVAINRLGDQGLHYIAHILTPEAQEFLKGRPELREAIFTKSRNWFSARHSSTKARGATWYGMPIDEINQFVDTHMTQAGFKGRLFEENPFKVVQKRSVREGVGVGAARAVKSIDTDMGYALTPESQPHLVGWREIMDKVGLRPYSLTGGGDAWGLIEQRTAQILETHGRGKISVTAAGQVIPEEAVLVREAEQAAIRELIAEKAIKPTELAGLELRGVPKDVAQDVSRVMAALYSPTKSNAFLAMYDRLNQSFKTYVTTPFLEFHFRNALSAIVANWYADIGFGSYTEAMRLAKEWGRLERSLSPEELLTATSNVTVDIGGQAVDAAYLLRTMNAHRGRLGQVGEAARTMPVAESFGRIVRGRPEIGESVGVTRAKAPFRAALAPFRSAARLGEHAGQFVEDTVRMAHVLEQMKRGMSVEDAILSMKKYQFDYAQLTPFEKNVMRRAVPFYTWLRKNTPLQIETLVTRPGKASTVAHFQRWLQSDGQGDGPMDSRIVPEWTRRRIYGAKQEGDDLRIISGIGIGLEDLAIFDRPTPDFLAGLNPVLKSLAQQATGKDFWRDMDLSRSERAPTYLRYFEFVPGGKQFLDAIDFKMVKDKQGNEIGLARANPKILNIFAGLPVFSASTRFSTTAERLLSQSERPGQPNPYLKYGTGLRLQHVPRREQMRQHMIGILQAADDKIEELRAQGVTEEFRSYFVERDILPTDPRHAEAKDLIRLHGKIKKALGDLTRAEAEGVRRAALRSGNR